MWAKSHRVNRHTGGLENNDGTCEVSCTVNRHTGGLEIFWHIVKTFVPVNRHTGGLENHGAYSQSAVLC